MDFLGLRTLTVIQNAVRLINRRPGVRLNIDEINYDDKNVFDLSVAERPKVFSSLKAPG